MAETPKIPEKEVLPVTWDTIKGTCRANVVLARFLEKAKEVYNLPEKTVERLDLCLRSGIALGVFNASNILLEDGEIVEVIGLDLNEERIAPSALGAAIHSTSKSRKHKEKEADSKTDSKESFLEEHKNSNVNLLKLWPKFLSGMRKNLVSQGFIE
jgi:hypothetical protein